jgi:hypothetical protein
MELHLNNVMIGIFCCFFISCSGQNTSVTKEEKIEKSSSNDTSSVIINIRNEFKKINSDTERLRLVTRDLEGISSEGGYLELFYDKTNLREAVLIAYGETGMSTSEYYFKNSQLIFIYIKDEYYDESIYDNNKRPKIKKEEENRFYFFNDKLIRWLDKNDKIVNPEKYPKKGEKLIHEVKSLLKQ